MNYDYRHMKYKKYGHPEKWYTPRMYIGWRGGFNVKKNQFLTMINKILLVYH